MLVSAATGLWGRTLFILVAVMGFQTVAGIIPSPSESSKISSGDIGIVAGIVDLVKDFKNLIAFCAPLVIWHGYWLLSERVQAGITKERNKDEAEIRKLELQKEILELELQKENLQTLPKDGEN